MKVTVHLIPIPPPNPTGPGPPVVHHYTTGEKLRALINSGLIRPSTAHIEPSESPVAWFSNSPEWEPPATKCPIPGRLGQLITSKAQNGLIRITVPASVAPDTFQDLPSIAGMSARYSFNRAPDCPTNGIHLKQNRKNLQKHRTGSAVLSRWFGISAELGRHGCGGWGPGLPWQLTGAEHRRLALFTHFRSSSI